MTVGFRVAGGTDLDLLFLARTSSPAAATGFKSAGGTDLNQRYEPRGSSTPIPATGFKIAGGTDLNQVFKNIADALTSTSTNLSAGTFFESGPSRTNTGFAVAGVISGAPQFGSVTVNTIGANTLVALYWSDDGDLKVIFQAGSTPADADTAWQRVEITGTWQGGSTDTRTAVRSARSTTTTTATRRTWTFNSSGLAFANGQTYTAVFYRA